MKLKEIKCKKWRCLKTMFVFIAEDTRFREGVEYNQIGHTPLTLKDDTGHWVDITNLMPYFEEVKEPKERKFKVGGLYPVKWGGEIILVTFAWEDKNTYTFNKTIGGGSCMFPKFNTNGYKGVEQIGKRIKFK
jgi:hypothetical protein